MVPKLNRLSSSSVRCSRKVFHLRCEVVGDLVDVLFGWFAFECFGFADGDADVSFERGYFLVSVPPVPGGEVHGDDGRVGFEGENAEAGVRDFLHGAVVCASAFGEDTHAFPVVDGADAFVEATVDADGAEVLEEFVPEIAGEFLVGGEDAELPVFVPGGEHDEDDAVDVAGVVGGEDEWLVGEVVDSCYLGDEEPEYWPDDAFADSVNHTTSFCFLTRE